jgi:glycosyltransferase involved in cell wall biosynthesis
MLRIGLIARYDNSGLGTMCWEFARHLKPVKVLLVSNGIYQTFPERYDEFETRTNPARNVFSNEIKDWLTEDIDVLLTIETFYDHSIIKTCRTKGVKTAQLTMCELLPSKIPIYPDLFLCPSKLDMEMTPEHNKVLVSPPFNLEKLKWRKRDIARVFVHTASHGGISGRKGTHFILEAMKHVKSDIKLIIYSWRSFVCNDPRVEVRVQNFKNYWQCWQEGDVLIYPQDFNGICLPICEAMCSGMAVITTNIFPFNEYLHPDLMFDPTGFRDVRVSPTLVKVKGAIIDPKKIAEKIDLIANKDIGKYSEFGKKWAEKNSWGVLLPKYVKILEELCKEQSE